MRRRNQQTVHRHTRPTFCPLLHFVQQRARQHAAIDDDDHQLCRSVRQSQRSSIQPSLYLANTATLTKEVGFVALADAEVALVNARYAAKTTGTIFDANDHTPKTLEQRLQGGTR